MHSWSNLSRMLTSNDAAQIKQGLLGKPFNLLPLYA